VSAYRESPTYACLRCGEALDRGDDTALAAELSRTCPRGCGEWLSRTALDKLRATAELGTTQPGWQQRTAPIPCRVCGNQMEARKWGGASFESCKEHGIWVDAAARREMHALLAVHLEQERRIGELMRELAEPDGVRALAMRLLATERRIDKLVAELGILEARLAAKS
jgi:Zn-finger nucleic acid-binding protein